MNFDDDRVPYRRRTQPQVTRFEVIDQTGRRLVLNDVTDVRLDYQDDGRTLKVFLREEPKDRVREYLEESARLFGPPESEDE